MTELQIRISHMEGKVPVAVLHVSGDVDASTHQELDTKAAEIINEGAKHILLDLTDNGFMSSAGFRSMHKIYSALKSSEDESSGLKLLNPSDEVKRLLKAMGFDKYFTLHSDLSEAVNSF
ncbi:MAG: STAS domain-containing protein, partial [Gammaproteobacteria bacterium]|nr:STAS domain-containing protein [Gammaproteobacteria bacterium]